MAGGWHGKRRIQHIYLWQARKRDGVKSGKKKSSSWRREPSS